MNKKNNKSMTFLNFGIFPGAIFFSVGNTHNQIVKYLKKIDKKQNVWKKGFVKSCIESDFEKSSGSSHYIELSSGEKLFYIVMNDDFNHSYYDYVTLAHEVTHICQFSLPYLLDRDNEHEAEAYMHSHIMTQALESLR